MRWTSVNETKNEKRGEEEATTESMNQARRGRASRSVRPVERGAPPLALPRSRLHLPSRRFPKPLERGRALSPPPRTSCGGRGSQFWLRSRELYHPPSSARSYRHVVPPGALRCPRGWRWLLLFGMRFKITIDKEKRLSQRVAAR